MNLNTHPEFGTPQPITPLMGNNSNNILLPISNVPKIIQNGALPAANNQTDTNFHPRPTLKLNTKNIQLVLPKVSHQKQGQDLIENSHETPSVPTRNKTDIACSFNIEFPHAGAFSSLIEYLHGGHGTGTTNQSYFEITDKTLTYTGRDASKTVLNCATIYSRNTIRFTKNPPGKTYRFFVKLKELRDHLKPFTKKNSVALAKYEGRSQLCIQTSSSSSDRGPQQIQFVELLPMDGNVEYNITTQPIENSDTPNAVIYSLDLHKMCKTITAGKQIEICGTETSICFGIPGKDERRPSGVWKFTSPHNNAVIGTEDNIIVGKASGVVIKNLGRLSALAPNSMISVYFVSDKDIKLIAHIEYLGILEIHITLSQVKTSN